MPAIGIADFGSYLPADEVDIEVFTDESDAQRSPLMRLPQKRRYVQRDERSADMVVKASRPMFERLDIDPSQPGKIDILITNALLPDLPITGCGAEVAHLLQANPEWIIDLHNSGCASFMYMLKLAQTMMAGGSARTALICNVNNTGHRIFSQPQNRRHLRSAIPGDGCGVAYLVADGPSTVLGVETIHAPALARDMDLVLDDGRKYWEPGTSQPRIDLGGADPKKILAYGQSVVPEAVLRLCKNLDLDPGEIGALVTNQPNRLFLRDWRKRLGVDRSRHFDTFDRYGNLYGAGVPVTTEHALRAGELHEGDLLILAGFAHAGDFAAAAAVRWGRAS